ncbi:MAG: hypothetical protein HOH20_14295 [Rhodospirillaceae bacterium]|jgi:hypothetical protein|nr:hypothetical protein [Rhodospirillaceae bacterium]MBT5240442.1 hypothetical protein [Rhodospirillaceae bacterium]MBT5566690.1 hypothetical protein [Rhodospirillaceae bacterium]MBT6090741.1 hypothetical protein [Rhodospirillaceae bacterium]
MPKDESDKPSLTKIKGRNPHFFNDPNIDRLLTMVMELASEVSVMRDRLDTHERLAATKGIYTEDDVENFSPNDDEAAAREEWRSKFLDRILNALYTEYDNEQQSK